MKPLLLEFCGVNSFSERAAVDFRKLLGGGIFGIFGDTGAGKSTILDCIGFALYGKVNRIGREGSSLADIVNYNCAKAEVALEFETERDGERSVWRAERTLSRSRGVQKAVLYRSQGDKFVADCEGAAQVNRRIENDVIGISFDDFKKCIALPQGEFSEFLRSSRRDRLLLVAKLFSLEKYGYALYKRTDERLRALNEQLAGVQGKLEAFAEFTSERLEREAGEEVRLEAEVRVKKAAREKAREEAKRYAAAWADALALASAREKLAVLSAREREMTGRRDALGRLQAAATVRSLQRNIDDAQRKAELARTKAVGLKAQAAEAERAAEAQKAAVASLRPDEAEAELQKSLAVVERAQKDLAALAEAEQKLNAARAEYRARAAELKAFAGFDYAGEKAKLEAALQALPAEDSLPDFIKNRFKSLLLAEEYAVFASELAALEKKYPVVAADVQPLIERYSSRGAKTGVDLEAEMEYFRKCAAKKNDIHKKFLELERKRGDHARAEERESAARKEGERLKADFDARKASLAEIAALGTEKELRARLAALQKRREKEEAAAAEQQRKITSLQTELAREEAAEKAYRESAEKDGAQRDECLRAAGMFGAAEAEELLSRYGDPEKARAETEKYFLDLHACREEEKRLAALVAALPATREDAERTKAAEGAAEEALSEADRALALARRAAALTKENIAEKGALEAESASQRKDVALLEKMKDLVKDNKFMEFIAVEYLQEIAAGANNLLLHLTNGRYFLVYDKNFEVGDNFNGGALRGVHTLSGGETFLVSLSLALSLSSVIHQRSMRPIEFFFLDEGFGTLDDELVDTVMDSLEKLKNDNFSIGIISHVGELKNRLENKITVIKADGERGSCIRTC